MEFLKRIGELYSLVQPVLDILVLSFLLHMAYQILVKTQAVQLLKGAISLLIIYAIAFLLRLNTLLWLLNILAPGLLIGVAIVFQPELRKIFMKIGQSDWLKIGAHRCRNFVQSKARHACGLCQAQYAPGHCRNRHPIECRSFFQSSGDDIWA